MTKIQRYFGGYIIGCQWNPDDSLSTNERRTRLVQTDWDFPHEAESLGWSLRRVQVRNGETVHLSRRAGPCEHRGTDGTITCSDCGITAGEFIQYAAEYLDSRCN